MLELFFAMLAAGMMTAGVGEQVSGGGNLVAADVVPTVDTGNSDVVAPSGFDMSVVPAGLIAEPHVPTGKFTTTQEVKPILGATKGNWVAVREYDGQDLLYVTHLWAWRCGLAAIAVSVNDAPMRDWPLPSCHMKYAKPNAVLPEDGLPYMSMGLGSVETITVQVVYDDLTMEVAEFARGDVLIP
jgi:hypothetical protein